LVDERVAGVWDLEEPIVGIFLFRDLEADSPESINGKAKEMGSFISGIRVQVKECDSMVSPP